MSEKKEDPNYKQTGISPDLKKLASKGMGVLVKMDTGEKGKGEVILCNQKAEISPKFVNGDQVYQVGSVYSEGRVKMDFKYRSIYGGSPKMKVKDEDKGPQPTKKSK